MHAARIWPQKPCLHLLISPMKQIYYFLFFRMCYLLLTLEYKVISDMCSTSKLLRNDLKTNRSFARKRKSTSRPDIWALMMSKSESHIRMFILVRRPDCENLTAPGGTGVSYLEIFPLLSIKWYSSSALVLTNDEMLDKSLKKVPRIRKSYYILIYFLYR